MSGFLAKRGLAAPVKELPELSASEKLVEDSIGQIIEIIEKHWNSRESKFHHVVGTAHRLKFYMKFGLWECRALYVSIPPKIQEQTDDTLLWVQIQSAINDLKQDTNRSNLLNPETTLTKRGVKFQIMERPIRNGKYRYLKAIVVKLEDDLAETMAVLWINDKQAPHSHEFKSEDSTEFIQLCGQREASERGSTTSDQDLLWTLDEVFDSGTYFLIVDFAPSTNMNCKFEIDCGLDEMIENKIRQHLEPSMKEIPFQMKWQSQTISIAKNTTPHDLLERLNIDDVTLKMLMKRGIVCSARKLRVCRLISPGPKTDIWLRNLVTQFDKIVKSNHNSFAVQFTPPNSIKHDRDIPDIFIENPHHHTHTIFRNYIGSCLLIPDCCDVTDEILISYIGYANHHTGEWILMNEERVSLEQVILISESLSKQPVSIVCVFLNAGDWTRVVERIGKHHHSQNVRVVLLDVKNAKSFVWESTQWTGSWKMPNFAELMQNMMRKVIQADCLTDAVLQIRRNGSDAGEYDVYLQHQTEPVTINLSGSDDQTDIFTICALCGLNDEVAFECGEFLQRGYDDPLHCIAQYILDRHDEDTDIRETILDLVHPDMRAETKSLLASYHFLDTANVVYAWLTIQGTQCANDGQVPQWCVPQTSTSHRSVGGVSANPAIREIPYHIVVDPSLLPLTRQSIPFLRNNMENDRLLFHGTSHRAATNIIQNGIQLRLPIRNFQNLDFGSGFYMATDISTAMHFVDPRNPVILIYKYVEKPYLHITQDIWNEVIIWTHQKKALHTKVRNAQEQIIVGCICSNASAVETGHDPVPMRNFQEEESTQVVLIHDTIARSFDQNLVGAIVWPRLASRKLPNFILQARSYFLNFR